MYTSAYLAEDVAGHTQREHRAAATRSHLARLASTIGRCESVPVSLMGRLAAAFRPSAEPCSTSC